MAVRNERVVLSLQDDLSTGVVSAAAAFALLDQRIDQVTKSSRKAEASHGKLAKGIDSTATSVDGLNSNLLVLSNRSSTIPGATDSANRSLAVMAVNSRKADSSINQLTGRLGLFRDLAVTIGPALSPIGGVLLAGIGGLANQLGVAALAGGSMVAAFQGVGGALEAVNKAALEPTTDNLAAASDAMASITPAARDAVQAMSDLRPTLLGIRDVGAENLFPGVTSALDSLESRAPEVERIVGNLNRAMGVLLAGGAAELAGDEWDEFFDFLATDARDTLVELGQSVGFLSSGLASMWMAFDPLNDDFSSWALRSAEAFSEWADALSGSEGFAEFVDYIRETGPQVADTFGAMGDAILQIIQATAPLGGPVLSALEAVANVVASIADSDLGTPFFVGTAALVAYNRTLAITAGLQARVGGSAMLSGLVGTKGLAASKASMAAARADVSALAATYATAGARTSREQARMAASSASLRTNLAGVAKGAGPAAAMIAGLGVASTGAADGIGLTNTASLALMGTMLGPWGTVGGATIGLMMDMKAESDNLAASVTTLNAAVESGDYATMNAALAETQERLAAIQTNEDILPSWLQEAPLIGALDDGFNVGEAVWGKITGSTDDAKESIEAAESAMASAGSTTGSLAGASDNLARHQEAVAATAQAEAEALRDAVDAMREKRSEAIRAFDAETNYHAAIDDATQGLKDNGRTLDITTEKGRANRSLLSGLADAWNNMSDAEKNAAGSARAARKQFVETAVAMGMERSEAVKLSKELREIPSKAVTNAELRGDGAVIARARAIRAELDAATKDRHVNVTVSMPVLPSDRKIYRGQTRNSADGGFVPKTGLPYADRHLFLLADGEGVTTNRNGETDRFRDVVAGINSGFTRAQVKGMLADGGIAGRSEARGSGGKGRGDWSERQFERAIDRLTNRLDKATSSLEDWRSKMVQVGEASTSQFTPDLFGNPGGAWGPGSSPLSAVLGSTAELNQRELLQRQLSKAGISGDAYASLMTGSNTDLTAFLASGEASKFQKAYDNFAKQSASVAGEAGKYAYGKQEAAADKRVTRLENQLKAMRQEAKKQAREEKAWRNRNDDIGKNAGKAVSKPASRGASAGRRKAATRS